MTFAGFALNTARGVSTNNNDKAETTMSDTEEFKAKPLTAREALRMNLTIAVAVLAVLVAGSLMMHYHVDPVSSYSTATAPAPSATPAKKL